MNRLIQAFWVGQALGWENVPRRIWHIAKGKLGVNRRRLPGGELESGELRNQFVADYRADDALDHWRRRAERFFVGPRTIEPLRDALGHVVDEGTWQATAWEQVASLPRGWMRLFNHIDAPVGWPPDFNRNPLHGIAWPTGKHWSAYQQFDPELGDLKCVWEASRFSVAYLLARDHVRQADSAAANLFWQLFDAWDKQNPYGLTAQWACGQESTFRLMAWLFAACATLDASTADAPRYHRLTQLVWYTARHVEENIVYARSQKNNHAVSEAVGLLTIGLMFPELRRADQWKSQGRRILIEELGRQVYADGSYVQHSVNYHRVMLDDVLWAFRLAALHGQPLDELRESLGRAVDWLTEMVDPRCGQTPNYGANDGAQVLPLSTCDYTDFRPVIQAGNYLLRGTRTYPPGPWDEQMIWLGGADSLTAPVVEKKRSAHFSAPLGGYYAFAGESSWALTRVHSYRDRPGQADMLHLDLWYRGVNVLRDGGSYHYFTSPPFDRYFESTAAHNTVQVDGQDQMIRGPRFLWLRWTTGKLLDFEQAAGGRITYLCGEHYGYRRLPGRVVHRRSILRVDDTYVVVDDVLGSGIHDIALHWRLAPVTWLREDDAWHAAIASEPFAIALTTPSEFRVELVRGKASPQPEGWESRYYAEKEPTPTLVARGRVTLPQRLVTVVGPREAAIRVRSSADGARIDSPVSLDGIANERWQSDIMRISSGTIIAGAAEAVAPISQRG